MKAKIARICLQVLAVTLIVLGFLGLFLPFLQGILMILAGVGLLSFTSPAFKARLDKRLSRFPRAKAHFDRGYARVSRWFGRL